MDRTEGPRRHRKPIAQLLPLGSAHHADGMVTAVKTAVIPDIKVPNNGSKVKAQGRVCDSDPAAELVLLFASLLAAALARQRFLHSLLLARLEVKGVTLHFLNNVLLLHFALEAAQGVL